MLVFSQITLRRQHKVLLEAASATIHARQKVGLTGRNGCGKSTLFRMIMAQWHPDHGSVDMPGSIRISHLSQETPDSSLSALDFVLSGDTEYHHLMETLRNAEHTGDDATILACHNALSDTGGYAKPAQAATLLNGLGFAANSFQHPVNHFSGGWRMRLALARCLMKPADLLLLDEPTNHLDMEAIFWLENWLLQFPGTVLVISHDREFLDTFTTHILHISQQQLTLYSGNYSQFEQSRANQLALQQALHTKQQTQIAHLMDFVNRFRAKASKSRQAQSRLRTIEKMEIIAGAHADSPFHFSFGVATRAGHPLIRADALDAGYGKGRPILRQVNLQINPGDRIALLGPNGEGKSTFVKTLVGMLPPLSGTLFHHTHLKIGYFAQHQADAMDTRQSPLEILQALDPKAREQNIRDFLGGFDFSGDQATSPAEHFSGGEKARLALARLVYQKPNLLLLDEPTNHLDLDMRAAMEIALQGFEGAMVLISHDRHLLRTATETCYLVYHGRVVPFDGDLDDYHQWLQVNQSGTSGTSGSGTSGGNAHQVRKNLKNRLKKLETLVEQHGIKIRELETRLADPAMYKPGEADTLSGLQDSLRCTKLAREAAEQEWMEVMAQMDE